MKKVSFLFLVVLFNLSAIEENKSYKYYYNVEEPIEIVSSRIFTVESNNFVHSEIILDWLDTKEQFRDESIDTLNNVGDCFKMSNTVNLAALINSECSICTEMERFVIAAVVVNRYDLNFMYDDSIHKVIFRFKQFSGTTKNNNCKYPKNNPQVGKQYVFNKRNKEHLKNILIARAALKSQLSNAPTIPKNVIYFFRLAKANDLDFVQSFEDRIPFDFNQKLNRIYHEFHYLENYLVKHYRNKKIN